MKITDERAARLVLAQPCPTCDAEPGEVCVPLSLFPALELETFMNDPRNRTKFHVARVRLVGRRP